MRVGCELDFGRDRPDRSESSSGVAITSSHYPITLWDLPWHIINTYAHIVYIYILHIQIYIYMYIYPHGRLGSRDSSAWSQLVDPPLWRPGHTSATGAKFEPKNTVIKLVLLEYPPIYIYTYEPYIYICIYVYIYIYTHIYTYIYGPCIYICICMYCYYWIAHLIHIYIYQFTYLSKCPSQYIHGLRST